MQIEADGTSQKKVLVTSCCFMGLSHILFLKEYLGDAVRYKTIEMELVAEELGIR